MRSRLLLQRLVWTALALAVGLAQPAIGADPALRTLGHFASERTDADGDGVVDIDDNCPDTAQETATPRGPVPTRVDGCGCPIDPCAQDADGDGVSDCLDACPGTHARLAVRIDGCPAPLTRALRVRLDVKFAYDRAEVDPAYAASLLQVREALLRYPDLRVRLEGHTDASGTDAYNQRLSEARAHACRAFILRDGGIAPERVEALGIGERQPVAANDDEAGMAQNRRTVAALDFAETVVPANDEPPPFDGLVQDAPAP